MPSPSPKRSSENIDFKKGSEDINTLMKQLRRRTEGNTIPRPTPNQGCTV